MQHESSKGDSSPGPPRVIESRADTPPFQTKLTRLKLFIYSVAWVVLLPVVILYFLWRSRRDPAYRHNISERFGVYKSTGPVSLWVHANSMGEIQSAAPIIRQYLDRDMRVVVTNMTPAGRRATTALFAPQIAAGNLYVIYMPFEFKAVYRRFQKAFRPKAGLVMEAEIWPEMINSAKRCGVPLFLCNAQYSSHKNGRKPGQFLANICTGYAGILAKSSPQAERFRHIGCRNIAITGETRFDQIVPQSLLDAAKILKGDPALISRKIVTIASAVEAEEDDNLSLINTIRSTASARGETPPLIVYVPRAKERFEPVSSILSQHFKVQNRSTLFDADLNLQCPIAPDLDILIGDSFGEMYFYLALSDAAVVGGGFDVKGAHNIIEPIAVQKPVFVGPYTWSIEYPSLEALKAGILVQEDTPTKLATRVTDRLFDAKNVDDIYGKLNAFYHEHTGSAQRVSAALPDLLSAVGCRDTARAFELG